MEEKIPTVWRMSIIHVLLGLDLDGARFEIGTEFKTISNVYLKKCESLKNGKFFNSLSNIKILIYDK